MSHHFLPIQPALIDWRDEGLFSLQYNDVYHAAESGIEQSRYVFIDGNNLIARWATLSSQFGFNIAETGFGTGLNFLLTWYLWEEHAPTGSRLHYFSCEKHPLKKDDLIKSLRCWPKLQHQAKELIEQYPLLTPGYHHLSFAEGRVNFTLMLGDAYECLEQLLVCGEGSLESNLRKTAIDAWYLDGFAPKKNEQMWSDELINLISLLSKESTTLASYTASARVKTPLNKYGFVVEKKKGFGPKRHMISAYFTQNATHKMKTRHTPWHMNHRQETKSKSAIIVGAGLAGCAVAYALANRGWSISLIDELDQVGQGGSGNQQAVLFPKLSAYRSPLTQLMLSSFLYANPFYKKFLHGSLGELNGSLLLAYNGKEQKALQQLETWLAHYPELAEVVDATRASELSGLAIEKQGLFIPSSGWINSPALCRQLMEHKNIKLWTGQLVEHLVYTENRWLINDLNAEVLILANGYKAHSFAQTQHLPIKAIQGQMTAIATSNESSHLKIPLCAEGHVLPARSGIQWFGASYNLSVNIPTLSAQDDALNYSKLKQISPGTQWTRDIIDQWSGVRATTPDYLPLVGPVPQKDEFLRLFQGLESNSKRWIPSAGTYYPGLYVCAGFGSRGLTTIPLVSEWLASFINNEMGCLPRNLVQAISPARFLRREIIRRFNKSD